ncbi:MAG TPA: TIGR01777 family protein [Anaerolineaceae bacterium]|nr:MAG: TIGR01777 family protein [Chloroflexi bacterium GWB2_54_36]HAL15494.1 TIGR01777 family protein [Anaerolineaceae bacterium]
MYILIAGGSGLIGTALTRKLLADNHTVTVLSRNPEAHSAPQGVRFVGWDGCSAAGWGSLVNETDVIVNLAGVNLGGGLWTRKRKEALVNSRLYAGQAIMDALTQAEKRPEVLVQASAVGYYRANGDTLLDESSPPGSDFQGDLCQRWEESTRSAEELGVRRVVIRSGVVFEHGAFILKMFLLPFRMFVGGSIGNGKQYISWIHINDEVNAITYLINNRDASGSFNLMSPQPVRNADLGRMIGRVLHRPYWFPVPAFAMRLALGELSTVVLDSWRGVPTRLSNLGFQFTFENAESALQDLVG